MDAFWLFLFTQVVSTTGFVVAAALLFAVLFFGGRKVRASYFLIASIALAASTWALKLLFHVPRPDTLSIDVTGYAFPSGHAAGSSFILLSLCYLSRGLSAPLRYVIYVLCLLATLAIGASRVYYGAHTWDEVLAGYALGVIFASLWYFGDRKR